MMRWNGLEAPPSKTYMFCWVIVSSQLHFHNYYLFVDYSITIHTVGKRLMSGDISWAGSYLCKGCLTKVNPM
jgi:hypothetical protein